MRTRLHVPRVRIFNIKRSLEWEKVSCAIPCGRFVYRLSAFGKNCLLNARTRLLSCGFHRCQRLCHEADCGACTAHCRKERKSWYDQPLHMLSFLLYFLQPAGSSSMYTTLS